jgi:hypothetical protein
VKRYFIIICISIFSISFSFAQESGKWRGGIEEGVLYPHKGGFGLFLVAAEVKYNVRNDMNVGLKAETTSFWKSESYSAKLLSFSITYDYYYHCRNKQFSPFVGVGLGYYFCKADDWNYLDGHYDESVVLRKTNNPTGFIRTGFEIWKFRTTLAYNVVRKPSERYEGKNIDYVSLSLGFYLGGGKWKKK